MKIKTTDLIGPALDWAVAQCEWGNKFANSTDLVQVARRQGYSTNWAQGGPIIEREWLDPTPWPSESDEDLRWGCTRYGRIIYRTFGPTPLIAAMRCYVASRLGDEVDLPEELLK